MLVHVASEVTGLRNLVRVTLARGGEESVGFAEGSVASTARHRLVATATVDALRQLQTAAECLDIDSAQVVRVGVHDVAIVTVVFVIPPAEQMVSGSAIVREHLDADAIVRAGARRDEPSPRLACSAPSRRSRAGATLGRRRESARPATEVAVARLDVVDAEHVGAVLDRQREVGEHPVGVRLARHRDRAPARRSSRSTSSARIVASCSCPYAS